MDEMEFTEAYSDLSDLISEYVTTNNYGEFGMDEEYDEDE